MHLAKRLHRAAVEGVDLLKLDAFDAHLLDELGEDAGVGLDGAPVGHIGDVQAPPARQRGKEFLRYKPLSQHTGTTRARTGAEKKKFVVGGARQLKHHARKSPYNLCVSPYRRPHRHPPSQPSSLVSLILTQCDSATVAVAATAAALTATTAIATATATAATATATTDLSATALTATALTVAAPPSRLYVTAKKKITKFEAEATLSRK